MALRPAKIKGASKTEPKKRMSGAERKSQIAKVAGELFAKNGFRGTTTREIALNAGISEAVIFKHFSKKEDLYKAIIDSKCSLSDGDSRLMKTLQGKAGKDAFIGVATHIITEHQKDHSFMRLLAYSALEKQDLSEIFLRTRGLELVGYLETQIKALVKQGAFKDADAALAARAFLGMVLHYSLSQELYGMKAYFKRPNEKVIRTFVDIFFEGMRRR